MTEAQPKRHNKADVTRHTFFLHEHKQVRYDTSKVIFSTLKFIHQGRPKSPTQAEMIRIKKDRLCSFSSNKKVVSMEPEPKYFDLIHTTSLP